MLLPIVLRVFPCYSPILADQLESSYPTPLLCQEVKVLTLQPCAKEMPSRNSGSRAKLILGESSKIATFRLETQY